ncbi:MAG: glycosyltransferase [Muribaculaceae bacterium]
MNIFVISIYSFPQGLAPTNRIKAYAKGLIQVGAKVNVLIPFPTDAYTTNHVISEGIVDSISYKYTSGVCKSKYKIIRALSIYSGYRRMSGFISSFIALYKHNKKEKIDKIIVSADALDMLFYYSMVSRILRAKMVFIFDEYPIPIRHKLKSRIPKWKELMYRVVLNYVDAYISISENLKNYYCNLCEKKTFILTSITDTDRFKDNNKSFEVRDTYFCYMGNMELSKDNVDLIIKAYAALPGRIRNIHKLYLYGAPSNANKELILRLIKELSLEENVLFKGRACFDEVPRILKRATILLSSQPDTVRAQGGFPTKLGEYLLSGTPTLLTDVGENSKFVRDGIEVFFAKTNSVENYTQKIEYIIDNYVDVLAVAEHGKHYVENSFSHTKQGQRLFSFLNSL